MIYTDKTNLVLISSHHRRERVDVRVLHPVASVCSLGTANFLSVAQIDIA